jgi:four helix bundle protein
MDKYELEKRTRRFALDVILFATTLPNNKTGEIITYQLVKAGTSVGANYHEANRAESRKDFIHKIAIVEKEAAESRYWLGLCLEGTFGHAQKCRYLWQEAGELLAIFTQSGKTAKASMVGARNSKIFPKAK